jgi:hypothetical protein
MYLIYLKGSFVVHIEKCSCCHIICRTSKNEIKELKAEYQIFLERESQKCFESENQYQTELEKERLMRIEAEKKVIEVEK